MMLERTIEKFFGHIGAVNELESSDGVLWQRWAELWALSAQYNEHLNVLPPRSNQAWTAG